MSVNPQGRRFALEGRVRWFSEEKGFGLIEATDGALIVVDYTRISSGDSQGEGGPDNGFRRLEVDCRVAFEVVKDDHGRPLATRVKRLDPEN